MYSLLFPPLHKGVDILIATKSRKINFTEEQTVLELNKFN